MANGLRKINNQIKLLEKKFLTSYVFSKPFRLFVEITGRCNLNCIMCAYPFFQHGDMSLELFKKVLPLFYYANNVVLQGIGESLLHPDFIIMLSLAKNTGAKISFATNGTVMNEELAEAIVLNDVDHVMISIDAATELTYQKIRRGGDFEKVINNIKKLNQVKKKHNSNLPRLSFEFVAMRQNISDLPKLVKLAKELEINVIGVRHMYIFREELVSESLFLYPELMQNIFNETRTIAEKLGIFVEFPSIELNSKIIEKHVLSQIKNPEIAYLFSKPFSRIPKKGICFEPWENFWITWQGDVRPCCYTDRILGNIQKDSFYKIWNGYEYRKFRTQIKTGNLPPECVGCPYLQEVNSDSSE